MSTLQIKKETRTNQFVTDTYIFRYILHGLYEAVNTFSELDLLALAHATSKQSSLHCTLVRHALYWD